jgi:hypothetical protein
VCDSVRLLYLLTYPGTLALAGVDGAAVPGTGIMVGGVPIGEPAFVTEVMRALVLSEKRRAGLEGGQFSGSRGSIAFQRKSTGTVLLVNAFLIPQTALTQSFLRFSFP